MPSNFRRIVDQVVALPNRDPGEGEDARVQVLPFSTIGIRVDQESVLFYRVDPSDNVVTLRVEINGVSIHQPEVKFKEETRTFHEVVNSGTLKNTGNELTLRLLSGGSINVSDIVLLYRDQ
jgi:hypothetical protein